MCFRFIILHTWCNIIISMPFLHAWPTEFKFTFGASHPRTTTVFLNPLWTILVGTFFSIPLDLDHIFIIFFNLFVPHCIVGTWKWTVVFLHTIETEFLLTLTFDNYNGLVFDLTHQPAVIRTILDVLQGLHIILFHPFYLIIFY